MTEVPRGTELGPSEVPAARLNANQADEEAQPVRTAETGPSSGYPHCARRYACGLHAATKLEKTAHAAAVPLYYRRWFSREPIDDQFVETIIKHVIASA